MIILVNKLNTCMCNFVFNKAYYLLKFVLYDMAND